MELTAPEVTRAERKIVVNEIQLFSYGEENRPVRTIEIDGEVWFVAKDVCDILELVDVTSALRSLDDDERDTLRIYESVSNNTPQNKRSIQSRGNPNVNIISEPGLYKLAFKSHKPEAKKFVRWVTHTVLPTIRRTGRFNVSESPIDTEPSVDAGLQRIGLIIRAAEHKAVPQSEQLRLLSMAVKGLTGTELDLSGSAQQKCQVVGLMELPEVFGVLTKGKNENFGRGVGLVRFYCILEIADALHIAPSEFNDFADKHDLKSARNGKWIRVKTPQGEAREFIYLRNVVDEYREEVR